MTDGTVVPGSRRHAEPDPLTGAGGRYVVGFDGSPASRSALAWAEVRAEATGHPVLLAGVVDDAGKGAPEPVAGGAARLARLLSKAADELAARDPGLHVSTQLTQGDVATALAQATGPADIVVIGSDKTGYAQGRVYGFRSLQLAATAAVGVAVVPAVDLRLRGGVVVAIDEMPAAVGLVRTAAREAVRRRSVLVLVHAVAPRAQARGPLDDVLAAAAGVAAKEGPGLDIMPHVVHRRAAEAILNLSRDKALLLVGHSRHPGALGVGGTLHEVLMNANVPTVILL